MSNGRNGAAFRISRSGFKVIPRRTLLRLGPSASPAVWEPAAWLIPKDGQARRKTAVLLAGHDRIGDGRIAVGPIHAPRGVRAARDEEIVQEQMRAGLESDGLGARRAGRRRSVDRRLPSSPRTASPERTKRRTRRGGPGSLRGGRPSPRLTEGRAWSKGCPNAAFSTNRRWRRRLGLGTQDCL